MEIDLSDFLAEPPRGRAAKPKVVQIPTKSPRPLDHVVCTQCGGSGKFVHIETFTPKVTEDQEKVYDRFNKEPPRQIMTREEVDCLKCGGDGHHPVPDDIRHCEIVMLWTQARCRCGAIYDGPAHTNSCMVRSDIYRAVVQLGVQKGWRYSESIYVPREITPELSRLPMRIDTKEYDIAACRKCVHEHVIICLPYIKDEDENLDDLLRSRRA